MNQSGNIRYQETDKKIQNAFLALLKDKPMDDISVREICAFIPISRPTFYSHYEDINDLILTIEYEKSAYISSLLTSTQPLSQEAFVTYLTYIKENKHFYLAYFQCEHNAHIAQSMMQQYRSANQISESPALRYHMLFFMAGLKMVVCDWLLHDCPESIQELSQILLKQYQPTSHLYFSTL